MKKLLLFIIILFTISVKAQTSVYHPFPDSAAIWREWYGYLDGGNIQHLSEYQYFINGDTLYDSKFYHKIYKNEKDWVWPPPPFDTTYYNDILCFGIREDTNKKVWLNFFSGSDHLLYDFNLNVGDTLNTYNGINNVIIGIDSVIVGALFRKVYVLHNYGWNPSSTGLFIIEGIGGSKGLINYLEPFFESGGILKCFIQNNQFVYSDSSVTNCDFITGLSNILSNKITQIIFPNPFHSSATLEISDVTFENSLLQIYNIFGETVKQQTIKNKTITISRDGLNEGIYFYRIANRKGQEITGKLMIK